MIYVVIVLNALAWAWALAIKFNDLKHIREDIKEIKDRLNELEKTTAQQWREIDKIKVRFNGK